MKKAFVFVQIVLSLVASESMAAIYMMVTPQELGLEIPSEGVMWQENVKNKEHIQSFLSCDDEKSPSLSTINGEYKFASVEACENVQMKLRLASPQCPLKMNINTRALKVNSFELECDQLKL